MTDVPRAKITILQPQTIKTKVERAAALRGMTVTSFINGTLERAADETLERLRNRDLSDRGSKQFLSLLNKPVKPNPPLRAAAKRNRGGRNG